MKAPKRDRAAYMRERRRIAADAGLCSKCTARKPTGDNFQCDVCIERGAASATLSRKKRRVRRLIGKR